MKELGNTPVDKDYKPSGIVNDLAEGQVKAVQLTDGTYITEKLAKSTTKAQAAAFRAFPGQPFIHDRCVFRMGYEQAEKDLELTWEDAQLLHIITEKYLRERDKRIEEFPSSSQEVFEEILRRYKEAKK